MRFSDEIQTVRRRKKKIDVRPGKSVSGKNYEEEQPEKTSSSETEEVAINNNSTSNGSEA